MENDDFQNWFAKQPQFKYSLRSKKEPIKVNEQLIDSKVESRLGIERLNMQLSIHNPELTKEQVKELSEDFKKSGGIVTETKDLLAVIDSKFKIPMSYIKSFHAAS